MADALRNLMGDDDCLKPSLTEMKLEPADNDGDLIQSPNIRKADKIRAILTETVSPESQRSVETILEQVHKLSTLDKLLLYLKLPTGRPADTCDPLRQPLNPLGSRSEIQLTINWIRSHYEEDPQVSLPKHEVYDDYSGYCSINSVKPLSTADFGKVMKQVFPAVRPRRLGTRGNSRYCYAGLRKRIKLDPPVTPDISSEPGRSRDSLGGGEEEVSNAASFLIREWVEKLLGVKFDNLPDLALHLLEKMYVDNRSVAAFTLLSRSGKLDVKTGVTTPTPTPMPSNGGDNKLQIQRKLQEVNINNIKQTEQQKRKLSDQEILIGKRSKLGDIGVGDIENFDVNLNYDGSNLGANVGVVTSISDAKLSADNQNRYSVVVQNNQTSQIDPIFINGVSSANGASSGNPGLTFESAQPATGEFQVSYNGDNQVSAQRQISSATCSISLDKLPRKKQVVLVGGGDLSSNNGLPVTSVIKAGDKPRSKYKEENDPIWAGDVAQEQGVINTFDMSEPSDQPADLSSIRVNPWSGPNSDNHEEELVQYFQHQEISENETDNDEKLSQLRQLLAKNLNGQSNNSSGAFKRTSVGGGKLDSVISSGHTGPGVDTVSTAQTNLSNRRRVSFHPLIVSDSDQVTVEGVSQTGAVTCPIPPSPGTRRRHFSFQPISPRACQPGSGQSPPASPFISPRSTPVHMLRSRHSSGSALPLHLLPGNGGGRQQHPSGSGSDISRAATFGSASESSTPFISPMGTPIPFIRSRHNSASGRLCSRSRHSSGVPLERTFSRQYSGNSVQTYTGNESTIERQYSNSTAPYSPMALNNLNNPFSPQPSNLEISETIVQYTAGGGSGGQFVAGGQGAGGGQVAVQGAMLATIVQDSERSRHSSAGSDGQQCHAVRSAPMSPFNEAGVHVRQRHVSAGHVPGSNSHTIHYRPEFEVASYNYQAGANNGDLSHHSSYRNTPIPQTDAETGISELLTNEEMTVTTSSSENKINNDDIDLALDALRNCDTDFIKFDEANSVSN